MAGGARFGPTLVCAILAIVTGTRVVSAEQSVDVHAMSTAALRAAYSLDFDVALPAARQVVAAAPQSPMAHRTLAAVLWLDIVFLRGAVTVDHYLAGIAKDRFGLPAPAPELQNEFKRELATALSLAEAGLKTNAKDVQALYDVGTAYGIEASYTASVEGSLMPAFRSAKRAFDAQEQVLERAPQRIGAGVIVGTYRYLISTLAVPARMFAYLMGFGGGKELGISLVERATRDADTHVEARTSLLLIYSREGRHADALRVIRELAQEFPRNRLFVLEEGATAIRAGKMAEAEATLTRGMALFDQDGRQKVPGERALWLYKRGVARLVMNRATDATADLTAALHSGPVEWLRGRILLQLGKLDDTAGRRGDAVEKYRQAKAIAEAINDPVAAAEVTRLLARKP